MRFFQALKPGLNLKWVSFTQDQWRSCAAIICSASDHYDEIADFIRGKVDHEWRQRFRRGMESMCNIIWRMSKLGTLPFVRSQIRSAERLLRFEAERTIPTLLARPDTTPEQTERLRAVIAQIEYLADQFKNADNQSQRDRAAGPS
jgi:hypothetical protein